MIEREGTTTGRWPKYTLHLDGEPIAIIRCTDRPAPRYKTWCVASLRGERLKNLPSRDEAEAWAIKHHQRLHP